MITLGECGCGCEPLDIGCFNYRTVHMMMPSPNGFPNCPVLDGQTCSWDLDYYFDRETIHRNTAGVTVYHTREHFNPVPDPALPLNGQFTTEIVSGSTDDLPLGNIIEELTTLTETGWTFGKSNSLGASVGSVQVILTNQAPYGTPRKIIDFLIAQALEAQPEGLAWGENKLVEFHLGGAIVQNTIAPLPDTVYGMEPIVYQPQAGRRASHPLHVETGYVVARSHLRVAAGCCFCLYLRENPATGDVTTTRCLRKWQRPYPDDQFGVGDRPCNNAEEIIDLRFESVLEPVFGAEIILADAPAAFPTTGDPLGSCCWDEQLSAP